MGGLIIGVVLMRVGHIRAIRVRVGWIKGFIYGCKSETKDHERRQRY
jgi:hypothetical protein